MAAHAIRWDSWILADEADRRFRRICTIVAAPTLALALLFTLWRLELPEKKVEPVQPPKRYVQLMQPKMVARAERKPSPRGEPTHAAPHPAQPQQAAPAPSAREVAQHAGLMQLRDQLASLRNQSINTLGGQRLVSTSVASANTTGALSANGLAGGAAATSGGIGAGGSVSAGQGGTGLGARRTGGVQSPFPGAGGGGGGAGGDGRGATRSLAEIQEVFDRNKGSLTSIYNRQARENPNMGDGKLVLKLTIAPDGTVTQCTVVSSSFNDPDFEHKIVQRILLFKFATKNVPPFTYNSYPIEFHPM
jgi:hypothetical protein